MPTHSHKQLTTRELIESLEQLPSDTRIVVGIDSKVYDVSDIMEAQPDNPNGQHYIMLVLLESDWNHTQI